MSDLIQASRNCSIDPTKRFRALTDYVCQVDCEPTIPARRYFRSGNEMTRMANVYYEEGQYENAFILYSKYITLFVEKLPKHPGYKECAQNQKDSNKKKVMTEAFPRAEKLKNKIKQQYEVEYQNWKVEEDRRQAELQKKQLEEQRADAERMKQDAERLKLSQEEQWALLQEHARQKNLEKEQEHLRAKELAEASKREPTPSAPPIQPSAPPAYDINHEPDATGAASILKPTPPSVDRSSKPHFLSVSSVGDNRHGFKDIIIPADTTLQFENVVASNTHRSIETCAVLAGKLAKNAFTVTHFILPKQSGTSDSCNTRNEEEIFDYQDTHDLITLGWIHTHPSQTAFLSSVDLHTHCSYQLMMPEAIAIVCAPKYNEVGIYNLTPDYGLDYIANCKQSGFHPHPNESSIYEESTHVKREASVSITVKDLR